MVDLVEAAHNWSLPRSCWADKLPDDIADQLSQVRSMVDADENVNKAAVTRALNDAGVKVGREAVRYHLTGQCSCE